MRLIRTDSLGMEGGIVKMGNWEAGKIRSCESEDAGEKSCREDIELLMIA